MKKTIAILCVAAGLTACSSHPTEAEIASPEAVKPPAPVASIEAQQVAAEQKADFVAEIAFVKNQKTLSPKAQGLIRKILKEAAVKGKVQEIKAITWADREFPSVETKKLPRPDQDLAKSRNREIENFIKAQNSTIKVKTYSMAERANALKDFVGSSEARIKKSLEVAGVPTTDSKVKFPSKASKSILLFLME